MDAGGTVKVPKIRLPGQKRRQSIEDFQREKEAILAVARVMDARTKRFPQGMLGRPDSGEVKPRRLHPAELPRRHRGRP